MSISLKEASQQVGLARQTILKAIRNGRVSAEKDLNGEWRIEPVELFRVWPPVPAGADTSVLPGVTGNTPVSDEVAALLRGQVDDLRVDRDRWREMAERLALTDQRYPDAEPRRSFWARLVGRM